MNIEDEEEEEEDEEDALSSLIEELEGLGFGIQLEKCKLGFDERRV